MQYKNIPIIGIGPTKLNGHLLDKTSLKNQVREANKQKATAFARELLETYIVPDVQLAKIINKSISYQSKEPNISIVTMVRRIASLFKLKKREVRINIADFLAQKAKEENPPVIPITGIVHTGQKPPEGPHESQSL